MRTTRFAVMATAALALPGCSTTCVPVGGGVLVDVRGLSSCEGVTVSATEGTNLYGFEATGTNPTDGGVSCEFLGLNGHAGSFTLQVSVDGQLLASQVITVRKLDECNVSAEMVTIDLTS